MIPNTIAELIAYIESSKRLSKVYAEANGYNDTNEEKEDNVQNNNNNNNKRQKVDASHDISHSLRVAIMTIRIYLSDEFHNDHVTLDLPIAAALLHDIVNVAKDSPQRSKASEFSANKAREFLKSTNDWKESEIEMICVAVLEHSFSKGLIPKSSLSKSLQDADRLEALGAIGIFRNIAVGVQMNAKFFDANDPWAKNRELDDKKYSVDHYFVKLLRLKDTMQTEIGKKEAEKRTIIMKQLLDCLKEELFVL